MGGAGASGPISFAADSLVAQGQVPVTGLYPVPLQVVRSGTYGQATVSWVIAIANPNSVSSTVGTVVIQDGKYKMNFFLSGADLCFSSSSVLLPLHYLHFLPPSLPPLTPSLPPLLNLLQDWFPLVQVEALTAHQANCTILNTNGQTPLDVACQQGHTQVSSVLIVE